MAVFIYNHLSLFFEAAQWAIKKTLCITSISYYFYCPKTLLFSPKYSKVCSLCMKTKQQNFKWSVCQVGVRDLEVKCNKFPANVFAFLLPEQSLALVIYLNRLFLLAFLPFNPHAEHVLSISLPLDLFPFSLSFLSNHLWLSINDFINYSINVQQKKKIVTSKSNVQIISPYPQRNPPKKVKTKMRRKKSDDKKEFFRRHAVRVNRIKKSAMWNLATLQRVKIKNWKKRCVHLIFVLRQSSLPFSAFNIWNFKPSFLTFLSRLFFLVGKELFASSSNFIGIHCHHLQFIY